MRLSNLVEPNRFNKVNDVGKSRADVRRQGFYFILDR